MSSTSTYISIYLYTSIYIYILYIYNESVLRNDSSGDPSMRKTYSGDPSMRKMHTRQHHGRSSCDFECIHLRICLVHFCVPQWDESINQRKSNHFSLLLITFQDGHLSDLSFSLNRVQQTHKTQKLRHQKKGDTSCETQVGKANKYKNGTRQFFI